MSGIIWSAPMIKKLQKKFILIATGVIFAVVAVLLTAINAANYADIDRTAEKKLDFIISNHGEMPRASQDNQRDDMRPPEGGFSPEMPYETRYFTVTILENGKTEVTLDHIAAVDSDTAENYAKSLYENGRYAGYRGDYKYRAVSEEGVGTTYVFLDCSRELDTFRTFLWTSIAIGGAGILVVFALILLLSNKVVKPYAESYNKQKQFITDANHELTTPLAVIKATNEVIEMENGVSEWTQTIEKQVARLTSLTDRLVFLSRMDEEHFPCDMSEFNLSETAKEIAAPFESLAIMQEKVFKCDFGSDVLLNGDTSLIGQLINILLDNAFKYSDEGGSVTLRIGADGKCRSITVTNTSDKIDTDHLDKLFDRFYRSDKSRNSETGGFGIGLSVAKSIVHLHKGKITAQSPDGKQMIFTVTFS